MSLNTKSFTNLDIYFEGNIYNKEKFCVDDDFLLIKKLYEEDGLNFLPKLDGIFAFCIYDKLNDSYFCARDRFGNIPLYYHIKNGKFIFATTIKEILKQIDYLPSLNKIALSKYTQFFSTFGEDTFYNDIFKLEESNYILVDKNLNISKKRYYKIKTYKAVSNEKEALENIENLLYKSIENTLSFNGAFLLSGGVDSSFLSALYTKISGKKVDTFSLGFDEYKNYCELNFAKIVSKHINSNHHELVLTQQDYIKNFYKIIDNFDEPHSDSASTPLNALLNSINKHSFYNVISGEGSDELFLGYDNYAKFISYYNFNNSLNNEQKVFLNEIIQALQNNTKESEYLRRVVKNETIYNSFGEIYNFAQKKRLFKKVPTFKLENQKQDCVDWMSYIDLKLWVSNSVLTKVYNVASMNNLQIHTPFLNKELVDYIFSIKSYIKVGDTNKYLLKKIALKYIPQEIINRTKKGFNSPYNEWLKEEFKDEILNTILYVNSKTDLFNDNYIIYIYELAKNNKFKQHLYTLFVFSLWFKKVYL